MTFTPIAVYFLYFIFSRPDSQLCVPESRSNTCFSEEVQPVCAIYTGDDCHSPTGFCYKTLLSTCDACIDPTIIGYTPGECEQPTLPHICRKKERDQSCEYDTEKELVCGYMKPLRFRGQMLSGQTLTSSCEACSSDQIIFHVPGQCQRSESMGVCRDHKIHGCSDEQAQPLCVYYTGDDCTEKVCRRTELNSCNVCQKASVLFYVKGACEGEKYPLVNDQANELLNDVEPQSSIPELEKVIQEDGSIVYEEVKISDELNDVEPQDYIPELAPVVQKDGSIVYEEVPAPECIVPEQDYIPILAPVVQEDGTIAYEEVKESDELNDVEPQDYIPELEAVVQEDGSIVYEEVPAPECIVPEQDYIPVLAPVVQKDGTIAYEVVEEPNEEATLLANEEDLVVTSPVEEEEEEKKRPTLIQQVIESRLLVNEPSN